MHGDVVQNLYLNREIRSSLAPLGRLGWLDKKAMRAGARAILDQVGIGGTISFGSAFRISPGDSDSASRSDAQSAGAGAWCSSTSRRLRSASGRPTRA